MEHNIIPIKNNFKSEGKIFGRGEVNELKEAFKVLEEQPDKVNPDNVVKMFRDLGYSGTNQHLINLFEYLTSVADGDGFINYQQFLDGCNKFLGQNTPDEYLRKVYDMYADSLSKDKKNVSNNNITLLT